MCFGGGGGTMSTPKREFQNRPVTVTGKQTGVDDPKNTKKVTEKLKIKRQKEEGTYVDPNLTTADTLTRKRGGMTMADKRARTVRQNKAKSLARARLGKKFGSSPTGRQTGVA